MSNYQDLTKAYSTPCKYFVKTTEPLVEYLCSSTPEWNPPPPKAETGPMMVPFKASPKPTIKTYELSWRRPIQSYQPTLYNW